MRGKAQLNFCFVTVVCLVVFGFTGCGSKSEDESKEAVYQKITAEQAKERIDSGDDLVVVDVRTAEEFEESHIPGAVLIPNETISSETLPELPDLNQEILVYCRSGNRSAKASEKLLEAGYTKVYDFGGIIDWPYETESGSDER